MAEQSFIEKIRVTEEQAHDLVEKAREQAVSGRQEARREAEQYVDAAYQEAAAERRDIMSEAENKYRSMLADFSAGEYEEEKRASERAVKISSDAIKERIVTLLGHN